MGHSKSNSKREIHSDISLSLNTNEQKTSSKQSKHAFKGTRRKINKVQS